MINVKDSDEALSTTFSKKLMTQCKKYGFEGHSPWAKDRYYCFHVFPINEDFNISILNKNTHTMRVPKYSLRVGNNEIFNNEEFAEYLNALQNAQNLVNYLNTLDWSKCPNIVSIDYNEKPINISNMKSDTLVLDTK